MGAIFGIAAGGIITYAFAPIAVAIIVMVGVGYSLDLLDNKYHLTKKLTIALEDLSDQIAKRASNAIDSAQRSTHRGLSFFLRSQGIRIPNY